MKQTRNLTHNLTIKCRKDLNALFDWVSKGEVIVEVAKTKDGYLVTLSSAPLHEKQVWGESFKDYANRVFTDIV